jgi:hypothetical protein
MIGFETIGNAIVTVFDGKPILVTDPWTTNEAYFGSWTCSHEIPEAQMQAIQDAEYAWVSHGHPDHLSSKSIRSLGKKKVLLPDHVGGRIYNSMKEDGFDVHILKDRVWTKLSDHVKILCISDFNQDGILLIDVNGRLIVNLNDASEKGWGPYIRKIVRGYETSFLLKLSGYGDADMINIWTEDGMRFETSVFKRHPVGEEITNAARYFGVKYFVPFSSFHRYQRSDSLWANNLRTTLADYKRGFSSESCDLLPAFVRWDCQKDAWEEINPKERKSVVYPPEHFGDNWTDPLSAEDISRAAVYFRSIAHLLEHFDFINLKVGGKENVIELAPRQFQRGITFEAPRNSLMSAIEWEIFDDMLIGNFMKTILHGAFPQTGLYPDFTPYVAKFADNGLAKSKDQLHEYFKAYWKRAPLDMLRHELEMKSVDVFRKFFDMDTPFYRSVKRVYHWARDR